MKGYHFKSPRNASWNQPREEALNDVKREICGCLRRVALRNGWTQRDLARKLLTSESTASRICRLRVERLTLNQLFRYLHYLCPHFKFLISI